jgi:APA family basic amino acid/polyamine antiporter
MIGSHAKKKIGLITATAFAIGAMIGGGVFVLTGVALQQTGPSAIVSFLIAGCIVSLSALSFAIIASEAGAKESAYARVGEVMGSPVWGFLTSWCFYLGGVIGAAFVLNAFGAYMHEFVFQNLPAFGWSLIGAGMLTLVNLGPASEIGKIETFLVAGKLAILSLLVVVGIVHFHPSDLQMFAAHGTMQILSTSSFLFIAFLGFSVITSISGDIDQPKRTVPWAILLSMIVVTVMYMGIVIALLAAHIGNYSEASVGVAAQRLIGPIGGALIIFGALVATLSSANANILGASEIMVRLAHRKQVPTILGHLKHGHPYVSVLLGAVLYVVLILSGQTDSVIGLANTVVIVALVIVNIAAAKSLLKRRRHEAHNTSLRWLLPVFGIVGAALQFIFIPLPTVFTGLALIGVGIVAYGMRERYFLPRHHREIANAVDSFDSPLGRTLSN